MTFRFTFALLVLALVAWPASAQSSLLDFGSPDISGTPIPVESGGGANILLAQAPNGVNGFFSCSFCAQSIADNFFLNQGIGQDVAYLEWYGGWFSTPDLGEVLTADVIVHEDAGGLPGANVCTLDNVVPTATATGVVLFGVAEIFYELDVNLGECNLPDNAIYWIEIFADVDPGTGNVWFWETGDLDATNGIPDNAFAFEAPGVTWMVNGGTELSLNVYADDKIPVELVSFDAIVSGTDVTLNWETASETNNAGFEVQLQNGPAWDVVAFVEGHGTTTEANTYSYSADMTIGTHTFRLKQIDFDGRFEYFGNVEVSLETPGTHVLTSAYPNPFNPQSQFTLAVAQDQVVNAELYNTLGQRVATLFSGTVEANQAQQITIDGAALSSGMYVVRVSGESFSDALNVTLLK